MSLSISPVSSDASPSTQEFLERLQLQHRAAGTNVGQGVSTSAAADKKNYRAPVSTPQQKQGLVQTMDLRDDVVGNWGTAGAKAIAAAQVLFFEPGNPNLGAQDIKNGVHTLMAQTHASYAAHSAGYRQGKVIEALTQAAIQYDVSAQQMADAMAGEAGFARADIDQALNSQGLMSPAIWQSIVDASVISTVRSHLNGTGIDGRGVIVRVQEPSNTTHGALVSLVVGDAQLGIAPGATLERGFVSDVVAGPFLPPEKEFQLEVEKTGLPATDPQTLRLAFKNMMANSAATVLSQQTTAVQDIVAHSAARVVNMSYGTSLTLFYDLAAEVMDKVPALKQAVLGSAAISAGAGRTNPLSPELVTLTNDAILSSAAVQQAFDLYVGATKTAADSGKVLVVAAGNSQRTMDEARRAGLALPDWAGFNMFAASDYVISVGASSTHGTPAQVTDDTLTDFSSQGSAQFHPTLATQGTQVPVSYATYIAWLAQPSSNASGQGISGTSFSAPIVSGAVALMLQQNPGLTFAQVKTELQSAAVDTSAPLTAEGAGMLDVVNAALV